MKDVRQVTRLVHHDPDEDPALTKEPRSLSGFRRAGEPDLQSTSTSVSAKQATGRDRRAGPEQYAAAPRREPAAWHAQALLQNLKSSERALGPSAAANRSIAGAP